MSEQSWGYDKRAYPSILGWKFTTEGSKLWPILEWIWSRGRRGWKFWQKLAHLETRWSWLVLKTHETENWGFFSVNTEPILCNNSVVWTFPLLGAKIVM